MAIKEILNEGFIYLLTTEELSLLTAAMGDINLGEEPEEEEHHRLFSHVDLDDFLSSLGIIISKVLDNNNESN